MNNSSDYVIVEFSNIELMRAESVLRQMDPVRFDAINYFGMQVHDRKYGKEFEGEKIAKCKFTKCEFDEVSFWGTAGVSSVFKECVLRNCRFKNACFDFSNFSKTQLADNNSMTHIEASSFTHTDFSDANLSGIKCNGCDFENSYFQNAVVRNSVFQHCNFENAYFENTLFEDIDLSRTSIDFSIMKNVEFKNVKLPFTGILHSFGGLQNIQNQMDNVTFKFPQSDVEILFEEFIGKLEDLEAFFFKINDFFTLATINIYFGNHDLAYQYLGRGLWYCLEQKEFRMIGYLCKLASLNHFFTKEQLQRLYEKMKSNEFIKTMNSHEYYIYLYELDRTKRMLVDNPFGLPQIKISVETEIFPEEIRLMSDALSFVDEAIQMYAPQASTYKTLRHNSPLLIEIFSSDTLDTLYKLAILLSAGLLGVTTTISRVYKIITEHNKIIGLRLDNELKEIEIESKRYQLQSHESQTLIERGSKPNVPFSAHIGERIKSISFSIYTNTTLPDKLRDVVIDKNK